MWIPYDAVFAIIFIVFWIVLSISELDDEKSDEILKRKLVDKKIYDEMAQASLNLFAKGNSIEYTRIFKLLKNKVGYIFG